MVQRLKPGRDAFTGEATDPDARRADIMAQIVALEARQHRPMRELALGYPGAQDKILEIEGDLVHLRAELAAL